MSLLLYKKPDKYFAGNKHIDIERRNQIQGKSNVKTITSLIAESSLDNTWIWKKALNNHFSWFNALFNKIWKNGPN